MVRSLPQVPLSAVRGAAVAVLAHDGVAAAADPADQEAREQEAAAVGAVEGVPVLVAADREGQPRLALLDRLPELKLVTGQPIGPIP